MSDDRRKINKQSTGTVPKTKYRNNTASSNSQDRSRCLTNNLVSYWHHSPDTSSFIRNPRRNNYFFMDAVDDSTLHQVHNGAVSFNETNGSVTPNTSSSTSRRNSSVTSLKCDNVTKYPDKKQIEDKLHQIREYLKITNSLMTSMKNSDDQTDSNAEKENLEKMMNDLKDSEAKLVNILDQIDSDENLEVSNEQLGESGVDTLSEHSTSSFKKNELGINLDNATQELDALKDQQLALMRLQQKAENKLRDARQIQSKLLSTQYGNDTKSMSNIKDNKNCVDPEFDVAIRELEERAKRLRPPAATTSQKIHDNILAKVESLHSQIVNMHNANDEREQLIETLDNRDAELRSQHVELQNKLIELQNKKQQVDRLVAQLQTFGDEEEDDVGGQVKKIVTMKDQLKKLKDMLEIVKTTENIMQNTNESQAACDSSMLGESFLDKEVHKPKLPHHNHTESNLLRYGNETSGSESQPKEVNKRSRDQGRGAKPRSVVNEKLVLQAELEAKKKEVEAIMGKHKASTSNLNHDVGTDIKPEFNCSSNTINEAWVPLISPQNQRADSDRFSSDEGQNDINDYTELQDNHNILSLTSSNYSPSNTSKYRFENNARSEYITPSEYERLQNSSRNSDRNLRSSSVATTGYIRGQPRSNSDQETRSQVQKQLHLIKSVCDSMLEQQTPPTPSSNVQQLRNNLTPSLYSEPHRFSSPNPHPMNALNVVNPPNDIPFVPVNGTHSNLNPDVNYQNWLATNTIQTQSFMMNTLNQCCQMLWLQQRELMSLRNVVTMLQERIENGPYPGTTQDHITSPLQNATQDHCSSAQYRPVPNPKLNTGTAAFSMPNLNQYSAAPPSNLDLNYINQNNAQAGRLLDPLNNVNVNHGPQQPVVAEHSNNVLHGVNSNINHALPNQMWNGQALNNQVAPGNRANNYWDNFRSYSRQNLLSTKNSEVLQNSSILDRSNTVNERTNPFTVMSLSKSNSEHDSASTSQENTPQRRVQSSFRPIRLENSNSGVIPPPDVLNINHNVVKSEEQADLMSTSAQNEDLSLGFQMLLNLNACNDACSNHSNVSEQSRRKNEWCEEAHEESLPKTKLFEELRENVYKEVASLISANESRPHFLIQLFRDLQLIGSDSLRLKILQSIQMIITQSLMLSQNCNRLDGALEQLTVIKEALPFLNEHENDVIENSLMSSLKQVLMQSEIFKETVKDTVFQKHFSNVLDEVLEQFHGKKVSDVKHHLVQTLNEFLCGELSFIQLIQETSADNFLPHPTNDTEQVRANFPLGHAYDLQSNNTGISQVVEGNIQNGDLAEADQSRVLDDDTEEEGAVGGVLEPDEGAVQPNLLAQVVCDDDINPVTIDFSTNVEGLDQVPTRLPTNAKSRSSTPNRD